MTQFQRGFFKTIPGGFGARLEADLCLAEGRSSPFLTLLLTCSLDFRGEDRREVGTL